MMIKNKDLETLIKMKNLIGLNKELLFKQPTTIDNCTITHDDFINFVNLIENIIQNKKEISQKQDARNKSNKEYHVIINQISYHRKKGNAEKLKYWQHRLEEYKRGC